MKDKYMAQLYWLCNEEFSGCFTR